MATQNITFLSSHLLPRNKKSLLTLLSLLLLLLLTYNGAAILCFNVGLPAKTSPKNANGEPFEVSIEDEVNPPPKLITHLPNSGNTRNSVVLSPKKRGKSKPASKYVFSERVKGFFSVNSCKFRFFMTWISPVESFGKREMFTLESLFKFNPNGCVVIVSSSMNSDKGMRILRPLLSKNFKVIAISPDFKYLLKHTPAESWFYRLKQGKVNPGEIPLGQNLSNLLRLALLYKFGGVYLDTDFVILRSFSKLRNTIGAQTIDHESKNWTRLNNAVMIFDKKHPILYKFIEDFALTFDGNKWGHNGPYLVSRVVARENGKNGTQVNILKPLAFYPVDWSRIGGFFRGPRNETHSKWLSRKYNQVRDVSYAVHLWNRQSRKLKIEQGSIISRLISDSCVFCNS